ncbi:MAG: SsrA-binding protein SmpB [Myxococcales bacterium]|nr:SsrA-binding protein SmpB [Myxococcales bacterium]
MARKKKKKPVAGADGRKIIARNKRAFRDFHISDRYEAGMVLLGSEVKSLREGRASFADGFAEIVGDEIFLVSFHISEYPQGGPHFNHDPKRRRKLLLHRFEIDKLKIKLLERGFTLVPLEIYFKRGKAKIELGLGKGKKLHDKREAVKERDQAREAEADMRRR